MPDTTPFTLTTEPAAPVNPGQSQASAAGWLNVRDFQAKGNGTADDTAALQAAIDACDKAGGGKIMFPPGNYIFTSTLTVRSHQAWEGANQYATTLEYRGDMNQNWLHGVDVEHWTVRDLGINGPSWGTPPQGAGAGILLERSKFPDTHFIVLENVHVQNVGGAAFKISNPIVSRFVGCVATNCGSGFDFEGVPNGAAGTSVFLSSCYANNCEGVGYTLTKMAYSSLQSCAADHNGQGYHVNNCDGVSLVGCGAEATVAKNGLDGASLVVTNSRGVNVSSCFTWNNGADAIRVEAGSQGVFIIGCVENQPTGTATASIRVLPGCDVAAPGNTVVSPLVGLPTAARQ